MPPDVELDRNTHFVFQHKVFSVPGCYFEAHGGSGEPRFLVQMGDGMGSIAFKALRDEFGIAPGSSDGDLLDTVAKGLGYVKVIRPNDAIPRELLDGSASWTVEKRHQAGALDRVRIQLVTLYKGNEEQIVPLEEIEQLANDPNFKPLLPQAIALVVQKLDLPQDRIPELVARIERLGHELSFIEGLRECFRNIKGVHDKVDRLSNVYDSKTTAWEEMDRIKKLSRRVIADVEMVFEMVDAQTCEIVTVLRNLDLHIEHIRGARDDLHRRFMAWDEMIEAWHGVPATKRSDAVDRLITRTYRFLARKYPQAEEWALGGRG